MWKNCYDQGAAVDQNYDIWKISAAIDASESDRMILLVDGVEP
jgi:hypothetical protein